MKPLVAAVAVLVALAVGAQAQTPDTGALRTRAEQGDVEAQWALGVRYEYGRGVPQDAAEAARWYRLAAEQGHNAAQFRLGVRYANGDGVPKDDAEAVRWLRLTAEQGHIPGQFSLGVMYANGRGVVQDYVQAHMWRNLAASRLTGEYLEREVQGRDAIAERMTTEQIAKAQRRAREWTPTPEP